MQLGMEYKTVSLREHRTVTVLFWKYAVALILCGLSIGMLWSVVSVWKRDTSDFGLDSVSRTMEIQPMRLNSLIAGKNRAAAGELVYLTRVLLKPGPAPKVFFLAGSQGTQILTVAEAVHVVVTPGEVVDVKGTISQHSPYRHPAQKVEAQSCRRQAGQPESDLH